MIRRHFPAFLFLLFLLILIVLSYKDYGIAWDEKVFLNVGKYYTVKIFDFFHIPTNLSTGGFEPTPYHTLGHGAFYDILIVFVSLPFRNFNFETLHLIRALFSLPIFFLVYWIVSKLISKAYGLIAMVFLLLFPRFYPDIFYNAVDIPTTLFFTLSVVYFFYYVKSKQTILKSIIFGFILAVTINQRLLLFYLPLLNFVFLFFLKKNNLKKFFFHQFLIFNFALLTLHLIHPYLLTHPITGLFDIVSSAKQYPWNAAVLFDGQFYQAGVNPLPWYYLPKTMLITIPPMTIILFIIGNIQILYKIIKNQAVKTTSSTPGVEKVFISYLLFLIYIPLILNFILKPTLYDSWRHFMFLTIPIIIIAILGLDWIFNVKPMIKGHLDDRFYILEQKRVLND